MSTVSVYKTNVVDKITAKTILRDIRRECPGSDPSFDLDDCDKILRVETVNGSINEVKISAIIKNYGYDLESML